MRVNRNKKKRKPNNRRKRGKGRAVTVSQLVRKYPMLYRKKIHFEVPVP
jgi:hypothetical protein